MENFPEKYYSILYIVSMYFCGKSKTFSREQIHLGTIIFFAEIHEQNWFEFDCSFISK